MPITSSPTAIMRAGFAATLMLAVLAVVIALVVGSATPHVVFAEFTDAGQLVKGDLVTVDGHEVGHIGDLSLTGNGIAVVPIQIDDPTIWPLRVGTRAQIEEVSLPSVANRFVALTPSSSGGAIPQHGTIGPDFTHGIVDLDAILNNITPKVRRELKQALTAGAKLLTPHSAAQLNDALYYLNPALSQTTELGRVLVSDRFALDRFVANTGLAAQAASLRALDLDSALRTSATWLSEVASRRTQLADSLDRAPAVMSQSIGVMQRVSSAAVALDPVLRDARPVARPAGRLIRATSATLGNVVPLIQALGAIFPPAEQALGQLPAVARVAVPSLNSLRHSIGPFVPIMAAFRPYVPDTIAAFFSGIGSATGYYDANGQYARGGVTVSGTPSELTGLMSIIGGSGAGLTLSGARTGLTAACPGGGDPAAADGSNPWSSPDTLPATGQLCDPADDAH